MYRALAGWRPGTRTGHYLYPQAPSPKAFATNNEPPGETQRWREAHLQFNGSILNERSELVRFQIQFPRALPAPNLGSGAELRGKIKV